MMSLDTMVHGLFSGLSAFPITPAGPDGEILPTVLRDVIAKLVRAEVDSIGLLGSTGNYPYYSRGQRLRIVETVAAEVQGRTPLLVGIGALRTDEVVRLARDALGAGASAGLLAPVSYTPLMDDEVFEHFATVAASCKLPLCIYNNPGTTHFSFSSELIARLSRVDGILAVKNPAMRPDTFRTELATLRATTSAGFSVGCSVDANCTEALLDGADAWYSVLAGTVPAPCVRIVRAVRAGDAEEARRLHAELQPVWSLFTDFTSLRVVAAMANLLGHDATLPRPILPLDDAATRRVGDVMRALGWLG